MGENQFERTVQTRTVMYQTELKGLLDTHNFLKPCFIECDRGVLCVSIKSSYYYILFSS